MLNVEVEIGIACKRCFLLKNIWLLTLASSPPEPVNGLNLVSVGFLVENAILTVTGSRSLSVVAVVVEDVGESSLTLTPLIITRLVNFPSRLGYVDASPRVGKSLILIDIVLTSNSTKSFGSSSP